MELLPAGDPRWADVVDALSWEAQWVVNHRAETHAVLGIRRCGPWTRRGRGRRPRPAGRRQAPAGQLPRLGAGELDEARRVGREAERCSRRPATGAAPSWPATSWPGSSWACEGASGLEELAARRGQDAEAVGDDGSAAGPWVPSPGPWWCASRVEDLGPGLED